MTAGCEVGAGAHHTFVQCSNKHAGGCFPCTRQTLGTNKICKNEGEIKSYNLVELLKIRHRQDKDI